METLPNELRDMVFLNFLLPSTGVLPWDPSVDDFGLRTGLKSLASLELVCKSWRACVQVQ